eukprot:NODE_4257_length_822_cov_29.780078_g3521_i0.p1 GENE.NODE_4257_length_822_cov_29.780078_g3521_i0~~NODE_4257_length_822_cov_29.780078_g3521_i0.p1  ORF type:complete len:172 (+),score=19.62 NODE_4257_length_822_cov_29.780078_g3521_i0:185-700(+)
MLGLVLMAALVAATTQVCTTSSCKSTCASKNSYWNSVYDTATCLSGECQCTCGPVTSLQCSSRCTHYCQCTKKDFFASGSCQTSSSSNCKCSGGSDAVKSAASIGSGLIAVILILAFGCPCLILCIIIITVLCCMGVIGGAAGAAAAKGGQSKQGVVLNESPTPYSAPQYA